MQLLELSPAEIAFLTATSPATGELPVRLTRKLAATLSARLRLPVQAVPRPVPEPADSPASPVWLPDAALTNLWLTRRLGGRHVAGAASFVPGTCISTLHAMLAECWLDAPAQAALPRALGWHITTDLAQATLAVQLPHSTTDMTRWAREVIRHG